MPAAACAQVEASQSMIRIVGLSATLPNYKDVGLFLGVNPDTGLFHFDASYRPVPLETQFVGVSERNLLAARNIMDEVAYQKVRLHGRVEGLCRCCCWCHVVAVLLSQPTSRRNSLPVHAPLYGYPQSVSVEPARCM